MRSYNNRTTGLHKYLMADFCLFLNTYQFLYVAGHSEVPCKSTGLVALQKLDHKLNNCLLQN